MAARAATATADAADLPLGGREPAINGIFLIAGARPADSLSASSRVLSAWYRTKSGAAERRTASKLAVAQRIVTPLSGAVVLEDKAQYQAGGLAAPPPAAVPEPSGAAALLLGAILLVWKALGRRKT